MKIRHQIGAAISIVLPAFLSGGCAPRVVSARQLYHDYIRNEIAADNTYKGKMVRVTGVIDSIGKDILDIRYIALKGGDEVFGVHCYLSDDAIAKADLLAKGQTITLEGRVDGEMANIVVKDCSLR